MFQTNTEIFLVEPPLAEHQDKQQHPLQWQLRHLRQAAGAPRRPGLRGNSPNLLRARLQRRTLRLALHSGG